MSTDATEIAASQLSRGHSDDLDRAIALLSLGLVTRAEFHALTGTDSEAIPQILTDPSRLASVQRTALQLRTAGVIARLEALRHAREAVEVAAQIMRDSDMHASNRLNAAAFIAKVSGTERPAESTRDVQEKHTIIINIGGEREPIVVASDIRRQ